MATSTLPPLDPLFRASAKRTRAIFESCPDDGFGDDEKSVRIRLASKIHDEYRDAKNSLPPLGPARPRDPSRKMITAGLHWITLSLAADTSTALIISQIDKTPTYQPSTFTSSTRLSHALTLHKTTRTIKPTYHPPWKLVRVISGHLGWVRSVAVEPGNQWFATGAGDRVIKIWDLASGELKLSLTGHISTVRGLAVSSRHPYLFSCGEDKMVRCWDLEANKIIRHYHGHLSGVYALSLHPTLDILVTAGRDASARVWDMRTKAQIHVLSGHTGTVADVKCQDSEPQVITGSMDSTVRLWDLAAGKARVTLTHHKKSVRALAIHPTEYSFASGSAGGNNIKKWKCPEGAFVCNFSGHNAIINTMSVNAEGALEDVPQPGSLEAEAGVFCSTFDMTGTRLITGGADKTIKIYAEQAQ
ncbi:WD40-repeat-containing domain protein [Mycena amicta]|nr:WD40-repeat-containing domain protein [Mycena amicta]